MATGQELSQIKQTAYFYNVNGLIEKDKNIYYAPMKDVLASQGKNIVCEAYFSAFNQVCPPPSNLYINMPLSTWSPEDRTLVVKGVMDNFRKGSAGGLSLNYIVIKREIKSPELQKYTYYSGYFISECSQGGTGSVKLTLIPDSFTNLFYWRNIKSLSGDYDPFNSILKNCVVNRQHYDRVSVVEGHVSLIPDSHVYGNVFTGAFYYINRDYFPSYESVTVVGQLTTSGSNGIEYRKYDSETNELLDTQYFGRVSYNPQTDLLKFLRWTGGNSYHEDQEYTITGQEYIDANYNIVLRFINPQTDSDTPSYPKVRCYLTLLADADILDSYLEDLANMDKFINVEEDYKYRQLFKDKRIPLNIDLISHLSKDYNTCNSIPEEAYEIKTLDEAYLYMAQLYNQGKVREIEAIASACIRYLHIITSDAITYPSVMKGYTETEQTAENTRYFQAYYRKDYEIDDSMASASQHLVIPFLAETKGLEIFKDYFNEQGIGIYGYYKGVSLDSSEYGSTSLVRYKSYDFADYLSTLNEALGYYIQGMFITPYSELSKCIELAYTTVGSQSVVRINFKADMFNQEEPTNPRVYKQRRGTWWSGYYYKNYTTPSKKVEDYDNLVIEKPTLVMLPLVKPEIRESTPVGSEPSYLEFKDTPKDLFEIFEGTISNPTYIRPYHEAGVGSAPDKDIYDYIIGYAFLVGRKGFEYRKENAESFKQVVRLDKAINTSILKYSYYDNVLETEPYSFYGISMGEIESVLDRKRYYQMKEVFNGSNTEGYTKNDLAVRYIVPIFYNQAVNLMVKIGAVPEYTINGKEQRYYTEELMYVSTSGVTVHVESYRELCYVMAPKWRNQMYLAEYNGNMEILKSAINGIGGLVSQNPANIAGSITGIASALLSKQQEITNVGRSIKAEKASAGNKADTFSQAGSDYIYEMNLDEYCLMLNHYSIDTISYNSIAKLFERYGYVVNIYDSLNCFNRVGLNYIKLSSFDYVEDEVKLTMEEEEVVTNIFLSGVTLLHDKDYLHNESLHNYETVLKLLE